MLVYSQLAVAYFELLATDPTGGAVTEGRFYYDTVNDILKWYTGAAWKTAVDTDTAQTLTSKTLTSPKINENVALTTTATKLNYLTSAAGTTGTASTNVVFSTSPSLTTPTLSGPVVSDFVEVTEAAAPSTPASGKGRLYASTGGKLKFINDDGITTEMGASSGNGEKNYVTNPSGISDVAAAVPAGWANVGDLDVVVTKTAADLPREYTTGAGLKITADANTQSVADYVYYDFTLDDVDLSKKLKIQWAQKTTGTYAAGDLAVVITTQADRTTAVATPVTTAIPAADGVFSTSFDAGTTATLSLVIRATTDMTTNGGIVISDVIVGPGIQPQGAVVTEWQSYTPTLTGGAKATSYSEKATWRRVGSLMEIAYFYRHTNNTGATSSAAYEWSLPSGYTIDTSAVAVSQSSARGTVLGSAYAHDGTNTAGYVQGYTSTTLAIYTGDASNNPQVVGNGFKPITGATVSYGFNAFVPIAEWAGSGTVNVAQNDVEYAYTTGTWDADDSTTGYGPAGATMGGALTAYRTKTVRFQTPIQATDVISVEIDPGLGSFGPPDGVYAEHFTYNGYSDGYGVGVRRGAASTDVDVHFGRYRRVGNSGTYAGAGAAWVNTYKWRVKKCSGGQAVGFGNVAQSSSGLVKSAGQLLGTNTNDSAATGYVGEYKENNRSSSTPAITSNTYTSIDSGNSTFNDGAETGITLTAGDWDITGLATFTTSGAVTVTSVVLFIGTATGTGTTGADASKQGFAINQTSCIATSSTLTANTGTYRVSLNATTTYYLKTRVIYSGGTNVTAVGCIRARRIR